MRDKEVATRGRARLFGDKYFPFLALVNGQRNGGNSKQAQGC